MRRMRPSEAPTAVAGEVVEPPVRPDPAPLAEQVPARDAMLESVAKAYGKTADRLAELKDLLEARTQANEQQQQLFNRLYDDLDAQRQERLGESRLSLYRSLVLVLDRLETGPGEVTTPLLASIRDELVDALAVEGVDRIAGDPRAIDARRQQVVAVVDSLPDGCVWREVRPGYEAGARVIRPQQIEVLRTTEVNDR